MPVRDERSMVAKEIGSCALCGAIVYEGDIGAVTENGALFCTRSCADEVEYILDGGETRGV